MKIWVTKWALSKGVVAYDNAEVFDWDSSDQPDHVVATLPFGNVAYFRRGEWHSDEEQAKDKARAMVKKAIRTLDKKGLKLAELHDKI